MDPQQLAITVNMAVTYSAPTTTQTAIVEMPVPQPGPGEVLVRLNYSGICHTDYSFCVGSFPGVPPARKGQVGGHEGVGEVFAQGPGVGMPIGSKVGIKFAADACLSCRDCLEGNEMSCHKTQISGYTVPGTFQQFCLSPERYVTPIPDGMDLASAAPLMCAGVSVYAGLKRAGVRNGDWIAVSGAGGGLGHLAIQFVKALGGRALAVDSSDKEKFCKEMGADEFLDFRAFETDESLAEKVKIITQGGVRIALVCASSTRAYTQAMQWLRVRGTMVCLGVPEGDGCLGTSVPLMINSELSIVATKSGNRLDAMECLEIAARCGIKTVYRLHSMGGLSQVFTEMEQGNILGRAVLDLR